MILCLLIMGLSLSGCDNFMNKGTPTQAVYQLGDTVQHRSGTIGVVAFRRIDSCTGLPVYLLAYTWQGEKNYEWFDGDELKRIPK